MALSNKQKAVLKIAKKQLGISEDQYRCAMVQIAGVTSATDMDKGGFEALMGFFEYLGFEPLRPLGRDFGTRAGMASFAQLELIRILWSEYTRGAYGGEDELNKWLLRSFKLSSLRFVTLDQARKIITALKAMKARAA